jgi:uncharacterized protein (DUF2141 family)
VRDAVSPAAFRERYLQLAPFTVISSHSPAGRAPPRQDGSIAIRKSARRTIMKPFFPFVAAALVASSMAHAADLTVEVAGLKSGEGKLLLALYDRSGDFLKQPARVAAVDAQPDKVKLVISGLPAGDYGISVFQDVNSNGKLDKNVLGMPVEPYGFSNDAEGNYGPPSFEQSRLHLPEAGAVATINLR